MKSGFYTNYEKGEILILFGGNILTAHAMAQMEGEKEGKRVMILQPIDDGKDHKIGDEISNEDALRLGGLPKIILGFQSDEEIENIIKQLQALKSLSSK